MAQKTPQKQPKPPKSSLIYQILAVLVVIGLIVAAIILNITGEQPVEPDDPPEVAEFISEGFVFYQPEDFNGYSLPDYAFVSSWDDIDAYFETDDEFEREYSDTNIPVDFDQSEYLLVKAENIYCAGNSVQAVGITEVKNRNATVVVEVIGQCGLCRMEYEFWLIPLEDLNVRRVYIETHTINSYHCDPDVAYKPVIYLYPEVETDITVKLGAKDKLLVSYPTYKDGWQVRADATGKLTDLQTGRELYSLYYEADNTTSGQHLDEGFVVKGADTVAFLEEKLAQLGLTDREAEEFIIYWLPQMQNNAYNYIYFAIGDEVAANMPLEVSPAPTTSIRINMEWKALDAPISVKPQQLPTTPERKGLTLVEWGGTVLK